MRVLVFLSVCHSIIVDHSHGGRYNSASPDELALVSAAKEFGFEFKDRDAEDNVVIIDKRRSQTLRYKLLDVCEFTSSRKRMSCIVKEPSGAIRLMCKGADAVIEERLSHESLESQTYEFTKVKVTEYASEGLRTLYLAERIISEEEFNQWHEEKRMSQLEITDREEKVAAVDEKIEVQLELIGSTAIEDKLQDEVADTINFMKQAGIKVWVLTGDKVETAVNIGVSAGLLDQTMEQHIITEQLLTFGLQDYLR